MNRRKLLQLMSGAALIPVLPYSLSRASAFNGRRVILLELSGANDGLNTLVPYSDQRYYELRPTIGLTTNKLISLDQEFALHNSLQKLMPLWEAGQFAMVHGLGYPSPNRSHFKSIALWETGGDGHTSKRQGWMTHDIEHAYASNEVDAHGIVLGGGMGIFSSAEGNWLSMSSADQFADLKTPAFSGTPATNPAMAMLLDSAQVLQSSLNRISNKIKNNRKRAQLRGGALSQQMAHAINIINSDVNAPVIKLSLGGFDTHENQLGRHQALLKHAANAIAALHKELKISGQWDNTVLVTYSEFGRRAFENKSGGTDHGTAAAHMITGGGIKGGLYGNAPDLGALVDGDLQHTMDYRAVYSRVLADWLQLPTDSFSAFADHRLDGLIQESAG